jgi:multiple sugar transport system substrate-binding protein
MRLRQQVAAILLTALAGCDREPDGKVVLDFWAMGREGEVVGELVRDFERANPTIRVHLQQIPWTSAHEKLLTAFAGGVLPDLCQLGNTWIPEFHALGALENLSPWVADSQVIEPDDYFRGIWSTNVIDGKTYGLPWYVDTRCVFYRKDVLAASGVPTFPGSWAGWLGAMGRVKEQVGDQRYPIFLPTNEWTQPVIFGLQTSDGLLRDNGRYGNFRSADVRRGFRFYEELFARGYAPRLSNTEVSNVYQEFARGTFAMYITGPWNIAEFQRRLDGEVAAEWGTAPIPGPTGPTSGLSLAGGSSLALFGTSSHQREAWRLIEFLAEPAQQSRFYELAAALPPRKSVWHETGLADDEFARAFFIQLGRVRPAPKVPEWEQITAEVLHAAEAMVTGRTPVGAGLAALDAEVDRILAKRRWILSRREPPRTAK